MEPEVDYKIVDFQFIIDAFEGRIPKPAPSKEYADAYLKVINFLTWQSLQSSK